MCEWLVAESCGLLWIKDAAFLSTEQVRSLCRHCMNYCAQEDVNVISTVSSPFTIQVLGLDLGLASGLSIDIVPLLSNLNLMSINIYLSDRSQTLAVAYKGPFCLNEAIRPPGIDQLYFLPRVTAEIIY